MLAELRVHNLALITRAELELGPGLTVLSGETGAGKTALLSSLKLLIGERGDSALVGAGCDEARVEALFVDLPAERASAFDDTSFDGDRKAASTETPDAKTVACEAGDAEVNGITSKDPEALYAGTAAGEQLVVRRLTAEGRSRCYLDDSLVTVGRLSEALGPFVDLYGQHEHQSLLKTSEQLRILDSYAGESVAEARSVYQAQRRAYLDALAQLHALQQLSTSSHAEREQAAFMQREIAKVAPQPGEYEALEQDLPRLRHGEQLDEATHAALDMLKGEQGVLDRLAAAEKILAALSGIDPALDDLLVLLQSHAIGLEEAASDLGRYASGIQHDPAALQTALDRLGELDGLSRRFGPGMNQVFAQLERAEQLLLSTEDGAERIREAEQRLCLAEEDYKAAAAALSKARKAALLGFTAQLNESCAELALTGSSLEFSVQALPFERWGASGSESFELLYRPAPDSAARALTKIASGGELSRVMLAVKSLMQSGQQSMTLVFDEIDAGVGGKTALAVAERLARLAETHQVIVITHLAQIAVYAHRHFLVDKQTMDGATHTTITQLSQEERVYEVARMLSGTGDEEALKHAQKMLREAQR